MSRPFCCAALSLLLIWTEMNQTSEDSSSDTNQKKALQEGRTGQSNHHLLWAAQFSTGTSLLVFQLTLCFLLDAEHLDQVWSENPIQQRLKLDLLENRQEAGLETPDLQILWRGSHVTPPTELPLLWGGRTSADPLWAFEERREELFKHTPFTTEFFLLGYYL